MLSVIVEEVRLPIFTACGLSVRKLRIHLQREGPRPRSAWKDNGLNAEL